MCLKREMRPNANFPGTTSLTDTCHGISFCFPAAILFSTKLCKYMSGTWRWRCHADADAESSCQLPDNNKWRSTLALLFYFYVPPQKHICVSVCTPLQLQLQQSATDPKAKPKPSTLGQAGKHLARETLWLGKHIFRAPKVLEAFCCPLRDMGPSVCCCMLNAGCCCSGSLTWS